MKHAKHPNMAKVAMVKEKMETNRKTFSLSQSIVCCLVFIFRGQCTKFLDEQNETVVVYMRQISWCEIDSIGVESGLALDSHLNEFTNLFLT